jgi:capsular polysaccharide biosynthesis protein
MKDVSVGSNWLVVENATVHVDTGLVFDAENQPVELTRYLRTGRAERFRRLRFPRPKPFGKPLVVGYNASWTNYYHWLIQCMFSAWLWARSSARDDALFLTPRLGQMQLRSWPYSRLPASRHYQACDRTMLSVPRVTVIPDAFRGAPLMENRPLFSEFIQDISGRISDAGAGANGRLYISRRDSSRRQLANEAELEAALADLGFSVVSPGNLSFEDQVRLFRSAEFIVSPHGAGLANVLFCRPGTRLMELMPSVRDTRSIERLSAISGVRHEVVLIPASGDRASIEWHADVHELSKTIGRAISGD